MKFNVFIETLINTLYIEINRYLKKMFLILFSFFFYSFLFSYYSVFLYIKRFKCFCNKCNKKQTIEKSTKKFFFKKYFDWISFIASQLSLRVCACVCLMFNWCVVGVYLTLYATLCYIIVVLYKIFTKYTLSHKTHTNL